MDDKKSLNVVYNIIKKKIKKKQKEVFKMENKMKKIALDGKLYKSIIDDVEAQVDCIEELRYDLDNIECSMRDLHNYGLDCYIKVDADALETRFNNVMDSCFIGEAYISDCYYYSGAFNDLLSKEYGYLYDVFMAEAEDLTEEELECSIEDGDVDNGYLYFNDMCTVADALMNDISVGFGSFKNYKQLREQLDTIIGKEVDA